MQSNGKAWPMSLNESTVHASLLRGKAQLCRVSLYCSKRLQASPERCAVLQDAIVFPGLPFYA